MSIKRKVKLVGVLLAFIIISLACFTACDILNKITGKEEQDNKEYTIMYSDGTENYTLTVKYGNLYSIPKPLPYKEGYEFSGLFDAEVGGTQYVTSSGIAVSPFVDKKNIVLFPQFISKEYTIEFDVGEETVNNSILPIKAIYGEELLPLPAGLTVVGKEHLIFTGWFTQKEGQGIKISGSDGISARKLDATLAALCDSQRVLKLYAAFELPKYTVEFYEENGSLLKEVTVDHGTKLADIAPIYTSAGKKIEQWKAYGSEYKETDITGDIVLTVGGYRCYIDYDYGFGGKTERQTAISNKSINLLIPTREGYLFMGWKDSSGNIVNYSVTLKDDVSFVGVWTARNYSIDLSVDKAEGKLPDNESLRKNVTFGKEFNLPIPETLRDEYEFIGWATEEGKLLTNAYGKSLMGWNIAGDSALYAQWKAIEYNVTLNAAGGSNNGLVTSVIKNGSYRPPVSERRGYTFQGWFDSTTGEKYSGEIIVREHMFLTARWSANRYEVIYDANGGKTPTDDSGQSIYGHAVVFDAAFDLIVPYADATTYSYTYFYSRNGSKTNTVHFNVPYLFTGWYTAPIGGVRLTDERGIGLRNWDIASDKEITVYAHWEPLTVKYYRPIGITATDDKIKVADTVDFKGLFGRNAQELKALGYTKLKLSMFLNLREVHDGYQEFYVSTSTSKSTSLWAKDNIEHTGGDKDTSSWTHYFVAEIDLSDVTDVLYFLVGAHGSMDDDWILNYIEMFFEIV